MLQAIPVCVGISPGYYYIAAAADMSEKMCIQGGIKIHWAHFQVKIGATTNDREIVPEGFCR